MAKMFPAEKDNLSYIEQLHEITHRQSSYTKVMNDCYYRLMELFEARWLAMKNDYASRQSTPNLKDENVIAQLTTFQMTLEELGLSEMRAEDAKKAMMKIQKTPYIISGSIKGRGAVDSISPIARFQYKDGVFNIRLTGDLVKYYLNCKAYDRPSPLIARSFEGRYTPRFYEWAVQWRSRGWIEISFDQIRKEFLFNEYKDAAGKVHKAKYPNNDKLKKKVFDAAIEEIRQSFDKGVCEFWLKVVEPEMEKSGKRGRTPLPSSYKLLIMTAAEADAKEILPPEEIRMFVDEAEIMENLRRLEKLLQEVWDNSGAKDQQTYPKWIKKQLKVRATNSINAEPDLPRQVLNKVERIYREGITKQRRYGDVARIIRKALSEDFRLGGYKDK